MRGAHAAAQAAQEAENEGDEAGAAEPARTPPRRVLGADVVKKIDALLAKIDKAIT